jgi:nitrile hydratase subunit beta
MDGVHDMGGMHGFGSVRTPEDDLAYDEAWEPRAQAVGLMSKASGGSMRRHIEQLAPAEYLALPYYGRWLAAAEQMHVALGALTADDLRRWYEHFDANPEALPPRRYDPQLAERVAGRLTAGQPLPRPAAARFAPGDAVTVRRMHNTGHVRCPRYVRGARGTIDAICGEDRLPGSDRSTGPIEPVYTVRFGSDDVWGPTDEPSFSVFVDLWESYLEAGQ